MNFNLLTVENADSNRNFVSPMSTWSKGCNFGSSGLGSSESQFRMTFFPLFVPLLHSMHVCICYKVIFSSSCPVQKSLLTLSEEH